jgi:predicted dehydrogenase
MAVATRFHLRRPAKMPKIRVAVVGAGAIGRVHAELIARSDLCELATIVDSADAGCDLAQRFGVAWHSDHKTMLGAESIDAAIISTPNATHLPVSLAFIDRGIPILVEKPIASTAADALALTAAAERAGVLVLVGHHRRHNPIIRCARDLVSKGHLGRLASVSILYTFLKPDGYFDLEWRRRPGGGPVLINLIHEIDLVRFVCGEIESVQAITSSKVRGFDVEDSAAVILRLADGALVTISVSDTVAAPWSWDLSSRENPVYPPLVVPANTHFLSGTKGSLTLPGLDFWHYGSEQGWHSPLLHETIPVQQSDPYEEQLRHLCRVVRGEEKPLVGAADATRTLQATLAVHEAAKTGQKVILT